MRSVSSGISPPGTNTTVAWRSTYVFEAAKARAQGHGTLSGAKVARYRDMLHFKNNNGEGRNSSHV